MPGKRPDEPIAPTNVPGQSQDPGIPPDPEPEVTPLDEDKHIEDGIEVDETCAAALSRYTRPCPLAGYRRGPPR